jgi:hypothetical protein
MSTLSHTLQPTHAEHLSFAHNDVDISTGALTEEPRIPTDDGLGCMRGLAIAILFNIILASAVIAGWQLWRILRW